MYRALRGAAALLLACAAHPAAGAVVPAPGFAVRTHPTPGVVQGGVVRSGNSILVGQGTFGAGTETIVRLDGTVATTIATGFNSLGGFDLDGGTLYVVDNCFGSDFGCAGAVTGDSLYAVPNAVTATSAVTATAAAVLPSGSFATPQDVLAIPGALLVSDAVGVGSGRVVKLVGTTPTNLITGLDFLGGLATDGVTLFVGNLDGSFVGSVRKYALASGAPAGTLVGGLSGSYGVARDGAGNVLVTGGFLPDFSSSTLVAIDAGGASAEWAHGFGFSGDVFYDAERGAALVLDFGVSEVAAICPDADADGVCDADCAGPATLSRAKVRIGRQVTGPGDDTLKLKGEMTIPMVPALDPVANGVRILVDAADGRAVVDVVVPGGAYDPLTRTGWQVRGATTWTFKHPTGVGGITRVKVKQPASVPGLVKVTVTGKNGGYGAAGAALPLQAVVSLAPAGQCGLATFGGPETACAFNGSGVTLTCK